MKKILVTGSLAFDYIMDFPQSFEENIMPEKLKTLSVSFLAHNLSKNFGGVAGNIGYNLALLKKHAIILASAGGNDFTEYKIHLEKTGVDITRINDVPSEFTANMFMITDKNNCQIAAFYPGAMSQDDTLTFDKTTEYVVVAPTVPTAMQKFVNLAKQHNIRYLYDPAQQIPRISKEDLMNGISGADILIGNDYELAMITKKTGWKKEEIQEKVQILITTLGEKGSVVETKDEKMSVGIAKPNKIVDPTGAGDSYIAGFLAGYLQNMPLQTCGQMAATTASYAIEQYGTQKHQFTKEEFKKRYTKAFGNAVDF